MSLFRNPADLNVSHTVKVLIYGQPGVGKSSLALSAPEPVLFDADGGVQRVAGAFQCPTLQVENWAQVNEALDEIASGSVPCKTIVVDTAGKLLDYMSLAIKVDYQGKYHKKDGSLSLQGYGVRKAMFIDFIKRVSVMGKNIVFVAHEKEEKDGEEKTVRPEIGGSSANDLIKELDLVGYMQSFSYETVKDGKHVIVEERTVSWSPTQKYYGKNTCNLPPVHAVAKNIDADGNIIGENNFLTLVFAQYEANLKTTACVRAKYDKLLDSFGKGIDAVTDVASANDVFLKIEGYANHVWDSKLRTEKMLAAKAQSLGLKFDPINNKYEAA